MIHKTKPSLLNRLKANRLDNSDSLYTGSHSLMEYLHLICLTIGRIIDPRELGDIYRTLQTKCAIGFPVRERCFKENIHEEGGNLKHRKGVGGNLVYTNCIILRA